MSDSNAIALLADPTKVDLPKKDTEGEMPFLSSEPKVSRPEAPPTTPTVPQKKEQSNIIDLLDETQEKPLNSGSSNFAGQKKDDSKSNILDLSDVQVKDEVPSAPIMTPEQIREKKQRILYDIERLRRRGVRFPRSFTMASDLSEMEVEYNRIKKDLETEQAIRFQRKMLMTCVSGIEMLNNRFDPFDVQLDGWSESVNENVGDYDEVFEELYEKYRGTGKMAPELRLLFMLGGSALMFHMTKSMFSSASPQISDVLRSNPGLAAQMQQAAASQMANQGGGLSKMMGLASGSSGVSAPTASAPPPRGVVVPPPDDVDDVLAELQGGSKPTRSSKPRKSGGGGRRGASIDTLSLSLNN